jgi:hypothetical protein
VTCGGVLVTSIQLGVFVAPLVIARAGLLFGDVAGLVAIVGWFVVGLPLSYAVADRVDRHRHSRHSNVLASTTSAI